MTTFGDWTVEQNYRHIVCAYRIYRKTDVSDFRKAKIGGHESSYA